MILEKSPRILIVACCLLSLAGCASAPSNHVSGWVEDYTAQASTNNKAYSSDEETCSDVNRLKGWC